MRPESAVLPAPAISQDLSLSGCGESLRVEELIPEPAVERLGKAILPGGSWLDLVTLIQRLARKHGTTILLVTHDSRLR